MVFVTFWEQPGPLISALRKWVEKDLKRDIHEVLRVDFNQDAVPVNEPIAFSVQFADCQYTMFWQPDQKRLITKEIENNA